MKTIDVTKCNRVLTWLMNHAWAAISTTTDPEEIAELGVILGGVGTAKGVVNGCVGRLEACRNLNKDLNRGHWKSTEEKVAVPQAPVQTGERLVYAVIGSEEGGGL
jgi:hypothetical protein